MKALFYSALVALALFEVANVYFIMPMPASQGIESLGFAYFLHTHRWIFRAVLFLAVAAGSRSAFATRRAWLPAVAILAVLSVAWLFNFRMTADRMFLQPAHLVLKAQGESTVLKSSIVIGIARGGEAKAYPIRYLVYHHQVPDIVGGAPILVTYCSVCRSGRVYEPVIDGHRETFRLVGMDHFNAMFEDATTGSWWRQATGEAVAGPLKGRTLPEVDSEQMTLREWLKLHPASLVMQPDEASKEEYDPSAKFERGASKGDLTRTDPGSWKDKSWVVGLQVGSVSKAYDWNRLKARRLVNDRIGDVPIVLVLAADNGSFAAFERPGPDWIFELKNDVLSANGRTYDFSGQSLAEPRQRLKLLDAHQEFWHSWRTFHPGTLRDL